MEENYYRQKMIETLVDPDVSAILLELEEGNKDLSYLEEKLRISQREILERLSYVIEHGFVKINRNDGKIVFSADKDKLNKIMESDENFSGVIDGLAELDSFLN